MNDENEFQQALSDIKKTLSKEDSETLMRSMATGVERQLELRFDEASRIILIQGDQAGLESLVSAIARLAAPDTVSGAHRHFQENTGFGRSDLHLIIQRIELGGKRTHQID